MSPSKHLSSLRCAAGTLAAQHQAVLPPHHHYFAGGELVE
jgi:hypothetical protein